MKLRLHVHRAFTGGWCADIDDDNDRQPDDPYWCVDQWQTLDDALTAGCAQLAALTTTNGVARVSEQYALQAAA
jgi:hypothetical protein